MSHHSAIPSSPARISRSSSSLPIVYTGDDDTPLIEAAVLELQKHDSDIHYLHVLVNLEFIRARKQRLTTLSFELGQELAREASGYRLLDYHVKSKSSSVYQVIFVCRYVGIADLAYPPPPKPKEGILSRMLGL